MVTLLHLTFGRFCFYFRSLASCWHCLRVLKLESWRHYCHWHSGCSGWSLIPVSYVWHCCACAHNHRTKKGHRLCCEQFHCTVTMDKVDQTDLGMETLNKRMSVNLGSTVILLIRWYQVSLASTVLLFNKMMSNKSWFHCSTLNKMILSTVVRRVRRTTIIDDNAEQSLHRAKESAERRSSSARYGGADPSTHLNTSTASSKSICSFAFSQWSWRRSGVMWWILDDE